MNLTAIPESAISSFKENELTMPSAQKQFGEHKAALEAQLSLIKRLFKSGAVAPVGINVTHKPTIQHLREFMRWCGTNKAALEEGMPLNQQEIQRLCGRNLNAEEMARRACLIGTSGYRKNGVPNKYHLSKPHFLSLAVCIAQHEIFCSHLRMNDIIDEDLQLKSSIRRAEAMQIFSEFQFGGLQNELLA